MTTKSKKTPVPEVVEQNGLQTLRPGEVLVMNATDAVVFVGDRSLNGPNPLDNYAHVVQPSRPTILRGSIFSDPRRDGVQLLKAGQLEIVDGDRGEVAAIVNVADTSARAIARDGVRPGPNRQQLIDHYQSIVIDRSLAEAVTLCVMDGIPEADALQELVRIYDDSFVAKPPTSSSQPWLKQAELMRDAARARAAGLAP